MKARDFGTTVSSERSLGSNSRSFKTPISLGRTQDLMQHGTRTHMNSKWTQLQKTREFSTHVLRNVRAFITHVDLWHKYILNASEFWHTWLLNTRGFKKHVGLKRTRVRNAFELKTHVSLWYIYIYIEKSKHKRILMHVSSERTWVSDTYKFNTHANSGAGVF